MGRRYVSGGFGRGTRPRLLAVVLACALTALVLVATPASARLAAFGTVLRDGGGQVILRGGSLLNEELPGLPTVTEADWQNMKELGWNSIRLGTSWRFIEPSPGVYDTEYLEGLEKVARAAMAHGLYVILDMHQDVWGPPFGDGAPQWTVEPLCEPLAPVNPGALAGVWQVNYLAPWTLCQFTSFWQDRALQAHFIGAWKHVAERLAGAPLLAGYDLFNEPFQGVYPPGAFEVGVLYPFYRRVAEAIRSVDPQGLVFDEPPNSKNVHLPTAPTPDPGPQTVYAPHVYGLWDSTEAIAPPSALVHENMTYSQIEARAMGTPLWFGEFGMRRGAPGAEETLTQIYDLADSMLAGTDYWVYNSGEYGVLNADGSLDPVRATTLSRTYPMRTAGTLSSFTFDSATSRFTMSWTEEADTGATVVFVPALRYPHGFDVSADPGVKWTEPEDSQHLSVTASPGPHSLTITALP